MPARINWENRKIGRVKILECINRSCGGSKWKCKCDCGNDFICWAVSFKRGKKFECKKCMFERKRGIDLTGRKYGRWTVLKRVIDKLGKTQWHCKCDCGNEGNVSSYALGRKGKSMSCGCLGRKERSKWANPSLYPKASGLSTGDPTFYALRTSIIHKCYNPNWPSYNLYGNKGITVCDLWRNSAKDMYNWALENGWAHRSCIVLKEGCKEFNPENVYVIQHDEYRSVIAQQFIPKIQFNNQTHSLKEWSDILDIDLTSLKNRLKKFPSIEEAFSSPHRKMIFFNSPEKKEELKKLYEKGKSMKELSEYFGVQPQTLCYHIKMLGLEKRVWNRYQHIKDEEIIKMISQGLTRSEIARFFNTTFTCINERLKRMKK